MDPRRRRRLWPLISANTRRRELSSKHGASLGLRAAQAGLKRVLTRMLAHLHLIFAAEYPMMNDQHRPV